MKSTTKNTKTNNRKIVAILGPTASGKSSISLFLAQHFSAEIVSCDSVQVFKELDIGSAKPTPDEMQIVPHHMINVFEPNFIPDVGIYKQLAEKTIIDIHSRNKLPLLTGGTGMYFNALYYGLFHGPTRNENLRLKLEKRAETEGFEPLLRELKEYDPQSAAKILPNDKRRLIRALEVFHITGQPLSQLHHFNEKLDLDWLVIALNRDRNKLYGRIERRVDKMIKNGLIEETQNIINQYGQDCYGLGSIGYRHCKEYLIGNMGKNEMIDTLKRDTRRYAKRQLTWFRKTKCIHWFHPDEKDKILKIVKEYFHL